MQQLQSLYRGDSSPSLSQIFGMQYQPQQAISQAANTAVGSGMSAGAQVKTTAMNNATQMAIADANRFENSRQFNLTNKLYNRNASENERHNLAAEANADRVTAWNTGGQQEAGDREATGVITAHITDLETTLNSLDKSDPAYDKKAQYLRDRIKAIRDQGNKAAGSRGGLSGIAKGITGAYAKGGIFQGGIGTELTRIAGQSTPKAATPAAAPVAKTPAATPSASGSPVTVDSDSAGLTIKGLSSPLGSHSITPSTQTLGGNVFNATGTGQTNISGVTTLGGTPLTGTITVGGAPATATAPAALTPPAFNPFGGGSTTITPSTLSPTTFNPFGNPPAGLTGGSGIIAPASATGGFDPFGNRIP